MIKAVAVIDEIVIERPFSLDELSRHLLAEASRILDLNVVGAVFVYDVLPEYRKQFDADTLGFGLILHSSEQDLDVTFEGYKVVFKKVERSSVRSTTQHQMLRKARRR